VDKDEDEEEDCLDALEHTLGCCDGCINVCICVCEGCEAGLELHRQGEEAAEKSGLQKYQVQMLARAVAPGLPVNKLCAEVQDPQTCPPPG
jgi:hypothetical protein